MDISQNLSVINVDAPITLAVAWTTGKNMKIRQVQLSAEIADIFREVVRRTIADINSREPAPWTPDADLSPETFLVLSVEEVGSAPTLTTDHGGTTLLQLLSEAERLEIIHPNRLPTGDMTLYAIVAGDIGRRAAFIRKTNPRRGLKSGRIFSILSQELQRIEDPIFAFDEWIDLVSLGENLIILSQTVFAALFRNQEVLAAKIPEWVKELNNSITISTEGQERLEARAKRDSRLRARLEAIVKRDHLSSVPRATLERAMEDNELDPSRLVDESGHLILDDEDIPAVLYLLNEDLFVGSLTSTGFRADKKAAR